MKAVLTDEEFSDVRGVISSLIGLEFPVNRRNTLIRNLGLAAKEFGFNEFGEFIKWLLTAELKKDETQILASYLTISETYFWRETHVFEAFTQHILPELIVSKKEDKTIRIWCAGCSTGEEPYSLAIALHRALPDIKDWEIKILATDINLSSLDKAITGVYTKWSFRNCPSWLQTDYFHNLGNERFEILPRIRKMVTFTNLNLTHEIYPSFMNDTHSMDIILCRNVLMYFSEAWVDKITERLYNALNNNGWFAVASCELSSHTFSQFESVNFQNAILYRKSQKSILLNEDHIGYDFSLAADKEQKELRLRSANIPLPSIIGVGGNPFMDTDYKDAGYSEDLGTNKEQDVEKVVDTDTVSATIAINDPIVNIRILANGGKLQEALTLCIEVIESDKLSIGLYSLRASIYQELEMFSDAIASLKQALYLNPDFIMGHFSLGNLFFKQEKQKYAKKYFNNVLALMKSMKTEDIVPESDGLSVKYLSDIIMNNLQKIK
jgi:chemotaxis protein methyltransferase CheR